MPTQTINFNEWLPDQPNIIDGLSDAKNVVPAQVGYRPIQSIDDYSNSASENMNNITVGYYNETTSIFGGGATKLFKYNSTTSNMDDVSKVGGYSGSNRWQFIQFGQSLLAANGTERIQKWTLESSSAFADLAANAPTAKYIAAVRDFVVGANLSSTETNKVQWSDINNSGSWTSGGASQADYQIIPTGDITGISGGEFGIIFTKRSLHRMTYIGSPLFWQFDLISDNIGCTIPNSIARYGNNSFFYSEDGFYMTDGSQAIPIGAEKIDKYFKNNADASSFNTLSCAIDPIAKIVVWCYKNTSGSQELLIYNWNVNRWSRAETIANYVSDIATPSVTLEGLDSISASIDALGASLDSSLWVGGQYLFAGINDAKIATFSGANKTGELITNDIELGLNSVVTLARPTVYNGSANISVASRKNLDDGIVFSSSVTADDEGRCGLRSAGRYHRIKLIPTGANWKNVVNVNLEYADQGGR